MTLEHVLDIGNSINFWNSFYYHYWQVGLLVAFIALVIYVFRSTNVEVANLVFFLTIILGFVILFANGYVWQNRIDNWKNNVVYPYVNNLPWQHCPIIKYYPSQVVYDQTEGKTTQTEYRNQITVSYELSDGTVKQLYLSPDTAQHISGDGTQYIEYKYVPQDLGHEVPGGLWNINLYLTK